MNPLLYIYKVNFLSAMLELISQSLYKFLRPKISLSILDIKHNNYKQFTQQNLSIICNNLSFFSVIVSQ